MTQSTIPIVTEMPPQVARDFGQRIAVEYWREHAHVFSRQGPNKPCGLCLLPDTGQHVEREPYPPLPTFTRVYVFSADLSCGHGPIGTGGMLRQPKPGDSYDCMSCRMDVDERNQPGLPVEVRARIEAQLPRCPECGGPIDKIPFIKRTVHKYEANVDFQTGEILAGSEHHDTLEEEPDWTRGTVPTLEVTCANDHSWFESRLKYEYDHTLHEYQWRVLEPES